MIGTNIGLNLKYLPWQFQISIMFGGSIFCAYRAFRENGKSKVLNIVCFGFAIMGFLKAIEILAINTGILAEYLFFLRIIMYSVFGITMFLMCCF